MSENPISPIRPIQCCARFRTAIAVPYFRESSELEKELQFMQCLCEMSSHSSSFERMEEIMSALAGFMRQHMEQRRIVEHFFFQTKLDVENIDPAILAGELARLRTRFLGKGGMIIG